jgi:PilZ domain
MEEPTPMRGRKEKRSSVRSVYRQPVRFDLNVVGPEGLSTVKRKGLSVDISEHGLGLSTTHALKTDEVLRLYIPLDSVQSTLPVFAKVAWAQPVEKRFRVGLEFLA